MQMLLYTESAFIKKGNVTHNLFFAEVHFNIQSHKHFDGIHLKFLHRFTSFSIVDQREQSSPVLTARK